MIAVVRIAFAFLLVLLAAHPVQASAFDHGSWHELLHRHVVELGGAEATQVDYGGLTRDRAQLGKYLAATSAVARADFDRWPAPEQLAFLINAYNAWTVDLIPRGNPTIASIRDLGSLLQSPWKKRFVPLLGETRSLDDIEHGLIRGSGRYREPRIHFAVNCASIGCPPLRSEPYRASTLSAQLDANARSFLASPQGLRVDAGSLVVTSILKWYGDDFVDAFGVDPPAGRTPTEAAILRVVEAFGPPEAASLARNPAVKIRFLDYDWTLNDVVRPR